MLLRQVTFYFSYWKNTIYLRLFFWHYKAYEKNWITNHLQSLEFMCWNVNPNRVAETWNLCKNSTKVKHRWEKFESPKTILESKLCRSLISLSFLFQHLIINFNTSFSYLSICKRKWCFWLTYQQNNSWNYYTFLDFNIASLKWVFSVTCDDTTWSALTISWEKRSIRSWGGSTTEVFRGITKQVLRVRSRYAVSFCSNKRRNQEGTDADRSDHGARNVNSWTLPCWSRGGCRRGLRVWSVAAGRWWRPCCPRSPPPPPPAAGSMAGSLGQLRSTRRWTASRHDTAAGGTQEGKTHHSESPKENRALM